MKRGIVVKFENLPARAVPLTDDSIVNVFGGCKKEGDCCDYCSCCGDMKCVYISYSSFSVHICQ